MADPRFYAKLDVGYFDNPKTNDLVEAQAQALIFHLRAILYCRQHLTDGRFPVRLVARLACATYCGGQCQGQCDVCASRIAGLVREVDDRTYEVHDYLEHQDSAEDIAKRKTAGQRAAAARWGADGNAKGNANGNAPANANGNAEGNAKERRGEERIDSRSRGTRIDPGFVLTDDLKAWADEKGYTHLDLEGITEEFVDYWRSVPGAKGTKLDWPATWRGWVRRKADDVKVRPLRRVDGDQRPEGW